MGGGLFDSVLQWELEWRGSTGRIPVFYRDFTSMTAIFSAATGPTRALLPPGLAPIELYPGRSLVAFTAFQYRDCDLATYNELSIAVLARRGRRAMPTLEALWQTVRRDFSAYVWQLPVTTEEARAGGVDLYGYPKFIATIDFQPTADGSLACSLGADGQDILTLTGRVLPPGRGRRSRLLTYSVKDGILLQANIVQQPIQYAESFDRRSARLELASGHAIADQLRTIDLSARPLIYQFSPQNQQILFAARNLIDV